MIVNSSLKIAITNSFKTTILTDPIDILATEIILYKYLTNVLAVDSSQVNSIQTLVSTYKNQFETAFISLKNVYISYNKIYSLLRKNNYDNNLLGVPENIIDTIYTYYNDNTKIVEFDNKHFSNSMYNIDGIGNEISNYLKKIHFNVMCPIIEYFNKKYGTPISNMKIMSSDNIPNNIGKEIVFTITDINPFLIIENIKNKNININYYNISYEYPNIILINN